jgi:hypothetical protein
MQLVAASSPGMEAAHKHTYVRTTVDILMQNRNLLRPTAMFLKQYLSYNQSGFKESLDGLHLISKRSDANGVVAAPDYAITLTQTLLKLYQQRDKEKINYQRGAIVELLVCKLVCHRYNKPYEQCLTNQKFAENFKDIIVTEVDVAALSTTRRKIEGYECKISPTSFKQYDCTNLEDLAQAANDREYRKNVGFVCFMNDSIMRIKLAKLQVPNVIKLYGLDSIEILQDLPLLDD